MASNRYDEGMSQLPEAIRSEYQDITVITDNERFATYKVQAGTEQRFAKVSKPGYEGQLENEVWWNLTCARLQAAAPEIPVQAPTVLEYGSNYYVAPFYNGSALIDKDATREAVPPHSDFLVQTLVAFDGIGLIHSGDPLYKSSIPNAYSKLTGKLDEQLKQPLAAQYITGAGVDKAKAVIEKYRSRLQSCLQHGDFVPWHMIVTIQGVVLIDGEHAGVALPRYYDLAYLYTRLFTRLHAHEAAADILKNFLLQAKPERFEQAFLTVMTSRVLGIHLDAYNEFTSSQDTDDPIDYRAEAKELLRRCLSEKLEAFIA